MANGIETSEIRDSKGVGVGVAAQFDGHGYHCYQTDCLERDPFGPTRFKYLFKQGKWFEMREADQLAEVTNAKLFRELTTVNEKLRLLVCSIKANENQQSRIVQ
jgi:hypothetical protein